MSAVRLIVATRSSSPPVSGKIIKEMPVSVASGTPYTIHAFLSPVICRIYIYIYIYIYIWCSSGTNRPEERTVCF